MKYYYRLCASFCRMLFETPNTARSPRLGFLNVLKFTDSALVSYGTKIMAFIPCKYFCLLILLGHVLDQVSANVFVESKKINNYKWMENIFRTMDRYIVKYQTLLAKIQTIVGNPIIKFNKTSDKSNVSYKKVTT